MHRRARRERTIFYRELRAVCRFSYRHAYVLVLLALALSVPAFFEARNLTLDTDLTRLLPRNSEAVRWSERLESAVGDGGYFSVIVEGGSADARRAAVDGIGNGNVARPSADTATRTVFTSWPGSIATRP